MSVLPPIEKMTGLIGCRHEMAARCGQLIRVAIIPVDELIAPPSRWGRENLRYSLRCSLAHDGML
jgi:hypothetical protein